MDDDQVCALGDGDAERASARPLRCSPVHAARRAPAMWRRITHSVSHGMGRASSSAIASAASAIRPCASIAWVRSA